jgi:hypothetical protein
LPIEPSFVTFDKKFQKLWYVENVPSFRYLLTGTTVEDKVMRRRDALLRVMMIRVVGCKK